VLNANPKVEDWQVEIGKAGGDPYEVDIVDVYVTPQEGIDEEKLGLEIEADLELATEVKPNSVQFLQLDALVERLLGDDRMKELHFIDRRPNP